MLEWNSLAHITLMLKLEECFKVNISSEKVAQLTSVSNIRRFLNQGRLKATEANKKTIHRGLNGITLDNSKICKIDNKNSKLYYRGYSIDDLILSDYEETAFLLLHGYLPQRNELASFVTKLKKNCFVTERTLNIIKQTLLSGC